LIFGFWGKTKAARAKLKIIIAFAHRGHPKLGRAGREDYPWAFGGNKSEYSVNDYRAIKIAIF
jgi:hypothetical protein